MPYFAPYLDETGLHLPTYADRLEALVSSFHAIFGAEFSLSESSPDYQLLSVFARALDDFSALLLALYNAGNPNYATGRSLDLLLPVHGLRRRGATPSTVLLTLRSTPGATLAEAPEALDAGGKIWRCRGAPLTLDGNGVLTVSAVCGTPGAVSAPAGSISELVRPVSGLSSVTNMTAAEPGLDRESDASALARFRAAATAPSLAMAETMENALRSVPNVRACRVYVNDGDEADARGIAAHSVCAVVAGGAADAVAGAIFAKKAPGIGACGSVSQTVTDAFGNACDVRFQRSAQIYVTLTVELRPLQGFSQEMIPRIRAAVLAETAALGIGQPLVVSSLYSVVYGAAASSVPAFSVSRLLASTDEETTSGIMAAAWNERITVPENFVDIIVTA